MAVRGARGPAGGKLTQGFNCSEKYKTIVCIKAAVTGVMERKKRKQIQELCIE